MKIDAKTNEVTKQSISVQERNSLRKAEQGRATLQPDKEKVADDFCTCTFD